MLKMKKETIKYSVIVYLVTHQWTLMYVEERYLQDLQIIQERYEQDNFE